MQIKCDTKIVCKKLALNSQYLEQEDIFWKTRNADINHLGGRPYRGIAFKSVKNLW